MPPPAPDHALPIPASRSLTNVQIVDDVLHNQVNSQLVSLGRDAGGKMAAISGKEVLRAEKTLSKDPVSREYHQQSKPF